MTALVHMTRKDARLFEQLKEAGVISDGRVYRMRLFSPLERQALRDAIADAADVGGHTPGVFWARDCSHMADELEMVNFQSYGIEKVERQI